MPTPPEPTNTTQWGLLSATGVVLAAGLRYIAKAIRTRRPSVLDGSGPITLAELRIAIDTVQKHTAQIGVLQQSIDMLNNAIPSHTKRIYQLEADSEESQRAQDTLSSKLDDLSRSLRVGMREIKDAIAELRPSSGD